MSENQAGENSQSDSTTGATWGNANELLAHMGNGANAVDASNEVFLTDDKDQVAIRQDYEVRIPSAYKQDSYIGQRDSDLRKARDLLYNARQQRPSILPDFILGLATTLAGWFLGGLSSSSSVSGIVGILMNYVAPSTAAALLTAFFFLRKEDRLKINELADRVLDHLANPDDEGSDYNEH